MPSFRGLWSVVFGNKKPDVQGTEKATLVSSYNTYFAPYSGELMDSDITRSCLRAIVSHAGKLQPKHIRQDKINPSPYLNELLRKPNPYMTMQKFIEKMVYSRELYNNAFAYIQRDVNGFVKGIYPINYSSVKLLQRGDDLFVKFNFVNGRQMTVYYTDLIHLKKDCNSHDFYGDSSNYTMDNVMNVVNSTDQAVSTAAETSSVIKWIMKFKNVIRPEDMKKQIQEFTDSYLSIDSDNGGAVASDSKYDLEQVDNKTYEPPKDTMTSYVNRIYSYFGVNESIVMNKYSEDEWNSFYSSKIEPIAIELSCAFTYALFSQRERGFSNEIIFSANRLTYASNATKVSMAKELIPLGLFTVNEMREVFEMEPVDGGDVRYQTLNVVNADKADEYQNVKDDEEEKAEEIDIDEGSDEVEESEGNQTSM